MHIWPYYRKKRQSTDGGKLSRQGGGGINCISTVVLPEPQKIGKASLADALKERRSLRHFSFDKISEQQLSDLLWAACGVSKVKGEGEEARYYFTNPTASNHREVSVYVFSEDGIFLYEPVRNELLQIDKRDRRKKLSDLPFVKKASVSLCIVSDIDKMVRHTDTFRQQLYSSMDAGYVSENIYLHCAANGLATCACGLIARDRIAKWLGLLNIRVMLVHPIGIKKEKI